MVVLRWTLCWVVLPVAAHHQVSWGPPGIPCSSSSTQILSLEQVTAGFRPPTLIWHQVGISFSLCRKRYLLPLSTQWGYCGHSDQVSICWRSRATKEFLFEPEVGYNSCISFSHSLLRIYFCLVCLQEENLTLISAFSVHSTLYFPGPLWV